MKTLAIQQQITSVKQQAMQWHTLQNAESWKDFCEGLNLLVALIFSELPAREVVKEVPTEHEVPIKVVEVKEVERQVTLTREVIKTVEVIVEVPVFLPAPGTPTP